jgi:RHS repeat-associated protein
LHAGHTRFEYDEHGRVIKRLPTISTGGEEGWSFRWDANDRLVEVTEPNGAVWSYKYDALGRRYAKRGPETSIRYVWDGDVILHEVMNSSASSTWLFDPCSFKLLGFIVGDELTTVLTDHLETPVAVATRRGIRRLEPHGVWGERAPIQEGSPPLPLHFPGQWWDNESGLYYSLYRYYDPSVARFISPDPLRVSAGLNLYAYTGNPVNRADPLGLNPSDIALGFSNPPMVTPLGTFPQPDGLYRFANNVGGTPYHGFDRTYPKAFPDTGGRVGGAAVYLAMQDANQIHFNLDGFPRDPNALAQMIQAGREGLPQHGNFTPWELATIMDDPELRGKARFYRDGEEVFGDPPADCAR